jgi:hypothetical protein
MQQRHHCIPLHLLNLLPVHTQTCVSESNDTSAQSGQSGFAYQIRMNKYDIGDYLMEMSSFIYDSTKEPSVGFI